jgi:hypothetical protein
MDMERLGQGRTLLIVGLIAALLSIPLLLASKAGAFGMVCLAVAILGGAIGILKVAEETECSAAVKWLAICLTLMPTINVLPIAWFLIKANQASGAGDQETLPPVLEPRRSAPPPVSPPPSGGAAANDMARILPAIKVAGLTGVAEGQLLDMKIAAPGMDIPSGDQPVCQVLMGIFAATYLIDQGDSYGYATIGEMQEAGLSPEALRRIGLKNLAAHLQAHKEAFKLLPLQDGAYGLRLDGHFESSLILLDSLWDGSLKKYFPTAPVVTLPSRDVCAFCDAGSPAGIAVLRVLATKVSHGGDHLISPALFTRRAGKWVPFEDA